MKGESLFKERKFSVGFLILLVTLIFAFQVPVIDADNNAAIDRKDVHFQDAGASVSRRGRVELLPDPLTLPSPRRGGEAGRPAGCLVPACSPTRLDLLAGWQEPAAEGPPLPARLRPRSRLLDGGPGLDTLDRDSASYEVKEFENIS